jgi:hypothetical protein
MFKINLIPQVGVHIEGVGQVNFGDSREQLLKNWGQDDGASNGFRLCFSKYGFFADLNKTDNTFEAVEFWNDHDKNVSEVFIFGSEVLQIEASLIHKILLEKNSNELPNDGWYVHIDVIYSGGSQRNVLAIIESYKVDGLYEENEAILLADLEKSRYFSSFGIGYKGYCKDGLEMLDKILNG